MSKSLEALALARRVLALCTGADQAQVSVSFSDAAYARFTHNYITQHLDGAVGTVSVTYVKGKRLGKVSTGDLSASGLRNVVADARDIAARTPVNTEFVSLPHRAAVPASPHAVFASTADATPDARVDKLLPVFARMQRSSLNAAGFTTTQLGSTAVVNSLGLAAHYDGTTSGLEIKAMTSNTSGYSQNWSRDYAQIDAVERAELAAARATISTDPQDFPPGTYTAILEPSAFLECVTKLLEAVDVESVLGDQTSWMVGNLGKPIFSPNVTIVDDWSHPVLANAPFADDGAPTKKLTIVERGVPRNFVSSTYLANKYKVANTGHNGFPTNAVVLPGSKSREQLIAETERGILISRMWYTRVVNPREATITGLTRDGVYLIENGKLTKTLKNFRVFTSMLTALRDVELGNRLYLAESSEAPVLLAVPDAKIATFTLSAQASFA